MSDNYYDGSSDPYQTVDAAVANALLCYIFDPVWSVIACTVVQLFLCSIFIEVFVRGAFTWRVRSLCMWFIQGGYEGGDEYGGQYQDYTQSADAYGSNDYYAAGDPNAGYYAEDPNANYYADGYTNADHYASADADADYSAAGDPNASYYPDDPNAAYYTGNYNMSESTWSKPEDSYAPEDTQQTWEDPSATDSTGQTWNMQVPNRCTHR